MHILIVYHKLFTTPLMPLPVEPRSLTLQTMEQILSLVREKRRLNIKIYLTTLLTIHYKIEVQDLNINQLLKIIREFASQGPAEVKIISSTISTLCSHPISSKRRNSTPDTNHRCRESTWPRATLSHAW